MSDSKDFAHIGLALSKTCQATKLDRTDNGIAISDEALSRRTKSHND